MVSVDGSPVCNLVPADSPVCSVVSGWWSYASGSSLEGGAYSYELYAPVSSCSVVCVGASVTVAYVPSDGCDMLLKLVGLSSDWSEVASVEACVVYGTDVWTVMALGCHHVTDCDCCRECAEFVHWVTIGVEVVYCVCDVVLVSV